MPDAVMGIPEDCGSVILSFDFEIGWGDVTNERWRERERKGVYKHLRHVLPVILKEMDAMEIPALWATVGALFEDPEQRNFSHLPVDAQNIIKTVLNEAENESFNGIDLFEMVLDAGVSHHIACHSYSHVPFTWNGMNAEMVSQDLANFSNVIGKYELHTNRLVYPENREKFANSVLSGGFEKVRVAAPLASTNRYINLLNSALFAPPMVSEQPDQHGPLRHSGSLLFHDAGKNWRRELLKRRVGLGLSNAISEKKCMHIWTHPFNFAESAALLEAFLETLRKFADARDAGRIKIALM